MDEKLKQRLVGAMVLVALAIIFLPTLFHKDERVVIDTKTEIPPAPVIEPVTVAPPVKPKLKATKPVSPLFQPKLVDSIPKPTSKTKTPEKPRLTDSGVPVAWVVQVASFKSRTSAEKLTEALVKAGLKAYSQRVSTTKGEFLRVFVGPFIDQQRALEVQKKVDGEHKVSSTVLRFNPVSGN